MNLGNNPINLRRIIILPVTPNLQSLRVQSDPIRNGVFGIVRLIMNRLEIISHSETIRLNNDDPSVAEDILDFLPASTPGDIVASQDLGSGGFDLLEEVNLLVDSQCIDEVSDESGVGLGAELDRD